MTRTGRSLWKRRVFVFLVGGGLFFSAAFLRAETVELVTYYPAPGGGDVETDRIHANRATVGDTYSLTVPADAALPDGTLLVEDRLGVGLGLNPPLGPLHVVGRNGVVEPVLFLPGAGAGAGIRMGIGTANPATELQVVSTSTVQPRGILSSQYSTTSNAALFIGRKARGSIAAPAAVADGDFLGGLIPEAYDGSAYLQTAWVGYQVKGTVTAGSVPTDFILHTGSSDQGTEKLRVTSAGNVGIGTADPKAVLDIASDGGAVLVPRKTTAGDPTGINGMIYYNANANRFRVYQNGAWQNLAASDWRQVYQDDFESGANGWSPTGGTTVSGNRILGGYNVAGQNTIFSKSYNLTGISHTQVRVELDYYSIDSWDDEEACFYVIAADGTQRTWQMKLHYDDKPRFNFVGANGWKDAIYHGSLIAPHSGNTLSVSAVSGLDEGLTNESFGIDNVEVWVR